MTIMLMGCILGFGTALFAYFGLSAGLFLSISIWAASGPISILLLLAFAAARQSSVPSTTTRQPETA